MSSLLARRHLIAGCLFALLGAGVAFTSLNYRMGSLRDMGPGFLPFWLGLLLAGLGAIAALRAAIAAPDETRLRVEPAQLVLIIGSILCFALLLKPLGLVGAVVLMTLVSSFASPEFRLKERLLTAAVLAAIAYAIFVFALNMPLPLMPRLLGWSF